MIKNMISLSDLTFIKSDKLLKRSVFPVLEKNQIVDAKVLQLIAPSKAELLIMGTKVLADTSVPLTKGETIQLKVTEQGELNVLKLMPESLKSSSSLDTLSGAADLKSVALRLSDAALQSFAKNQPFEGFTKLAAVLFSEVSNIKKSSVFLKDEPVAKHLSDSKADKPVSGKGNSALAQSDTTVINKDNGTLLKTQPDTIVPDKSEIIRNLSDSKTDKPVSGKGNSALAQSDTTVINKDNGTLLKTRPDTIVPDKSEIIRNLSDSKTDKLVETKESSKLFESSSGTIVSGKDVVVKNLSDKSAKPAATKESVSSLAGRFDKAVTDKSDIRDLLISVALKSEKADIDFLPQLLQKSGLLLEKKISDMIKNSSILKEPVDRSSSNISDSPASPKTSTPLSGNNLSRVSSRFSPNPSPGSKDIAASNIQSASVARNTASTAIIQNSTNLLHNPEKLVKEDIKGAVLNFMAESGAESSPDIKVFHEFIQNLESVQLLNSHLAESGKYLIPFPMFNGEQFSFGQLFIDVGQKKEENSPASKENALLRVSIFLDMTRLGPVRADFSVLKNNITGGFQVSDEETALFFRQMLPELKARLQTHEYQIHNIDCRVVELEKLTEKTLINEILRSGDHGFSVMI